MFRSNRYLLVAASIGVVSILCLMLLYRQLAVSALVDHESRSNEALTRVMANVVWTHYRNLIDLDSAEIAAQGADHPVIVLLDREVKKAMRGSRLIKVKIYDREGLTVFSTDTTQIGEDKSNNEGFLGAQNGETISLMSYRNQFDTFEGLRSNLNVVSSYIPMHASGEVEAVFELYTDVTELVDQMRFIQWQILFGVLLSVSILYGLLLAFSRRVDRIEAERREEALRNEAQLRYQASHDALTGLINRHEFERRAESLIDEAMLGIAEHAFCFMDLDQFKLINDTCGHVAGDELLRQLGHILSDCLGPQDSLARLGGDEFGVLLENSNQEVALETANKLQQTVQDLQFCWDGKIFRIGVSIGLVAIDASTPDLKILLQQADAACYMAKDLGRNRIQVYREGETMISVRHGEMQWVTQITQALEEGRFTLFAQPIQSLEADDDLHYEILIRMLDPDGNYVLPGNFIPAAERFDMMEKIDEWGVDKALKLLATNPEFVDRISMMAINLSAQSLVKEGFLESIVTRITELEIDPKKLCFEVTETAAIANLRAAIEFITRLRELGCKFALDDFGSGLSSFGYLKNLPVDFLKIDGMFVKDIVVDPIDYGMVKSINDIGHVMGMKTIAEFVENHQIKEILVDMGVDYIQGYGIDRPQPLEQIVELVTHRKAS